MDAAALLGDANMSHHSTLLHTHRFIYDLFTNMKFVTQSPSMLIAFNKSDLPGAASVDELRQRLERSLCVPYAEYTVLC